MCDTSLAGLEPIFTKARELQKERLQSIFQNGFKLPERICEKYFLCYQASKGSEQKMDQDMYKFIFDQFWGEVREQLTVPDELNNLDQATLFGEVCLGEHLKTAG